MSAMLEFENACSGVDGIPSAADFQEWLTHTLAYLPPQAQSKPVIVSLRIVDAAESQQLNNDYRHKDYATNVLSFHNALPTAVLAALDEIPLGDLAICAPVVTQEAREQNKSLQAHWTHLFVHGLLHLHGYDHVDEAEADSMEALEIRILHALGIANPYNETPLSS